MADYFNYCTSCGAQFRNKTHAESHNCNDTLEFIGYYCEVCGREGTDAVVMGYHVCASHTCHHRAFMKGQEDAWERINSCQ